MMTEETSLSFALQETNCLLLIRECNSLKAAVGLKHLKCIKNILMQNFNVKQEKQNDEIPLLHIIMKYGNYNDKSQNQEDPDFKEKGVECLKLLLESNGTVTDAEEGPESSFNGFSRNIDARYEGFTPLQRAAIQGNGAYVTELLER